MLTDNAFIVAQRLREQVGSDINGVGLDNQQLCTLFDNFDSNELRDALNELAQIGFIRLDEGMPASAAGIPKALRNIAGVGVMEPMQVYFDGQ